MRICLIGLLCASLAACGDSADTPPTPAPEKGSESTTPPKKKEAAELEVRKEFPPTPKPGTQEKPGAQEEGVRLKPSEESHDFGRVPDTEKVSHEFTLTNVSDEPITIDDVKVTCGCLAPEIDAKGLFPGKSAKVRITFDPAMRQGKQIKKVQVMVSGKTEVELQLAAEVVPRIGIYPRSIWLGEGKRGEPIGPKTVKIVSRLPDLELGEATLMDDRFTVKSLGEARNEQDHGDDVTVWEYELGFSGAPEAGRVQTSMMLPTNLKNRPRLSAAVFAAVVGPVAVVPDTLSCGSHAGGAEFTKDVRVNLRKGGKFTIKSAKVADKDGVTFSTAIVPHGMIPDAMVVKVVAKTPNVEGRGLSRVESVLEIETDVESQPLVKVPVFLYVKGQIQKGN